MSVFNDFWTKMTEISWGFFSRRQKVKISLYLMSFDDFLFFLYYFFQRSKSRKCLVVPMVPYGTVWYHMVPYDPPPGVGRDAVGTPNFFRIFDPWENIFLISKNKKHQNSSNIKEFWPFDVWKRIPTKFLSFWFKNHWKRTILSRVMILFGCMM